MACRSPDKDSQRYVAVRRNRCGDDRPPAPAGFEQGHPNIRRLFEDFMLVEQAYHAQTGIFPMMHLVAIRKDVVRDNPWVPMSVYTAFREARRRSIERALYIDASRSPIPWRHELAAHAKSSFGNLWPYGTEGNRMTLDAVYCTRSNRGLSSQAAAGGPVCKTGSKLFPYVGQPAYSSVEGNSRMSKTASSRAYADLHEHIRALDRAGLLYRISDPINKDTEMHPLVRWQFRGGISEADRKAFLFSNVVDSKGRRYDLPVLVGAFATTPEIYRIGMNVPTIQDIGPAWENAIRNPIEPQLVDAAPCQEVVVTGRNLEGTGNGMESLPIPISTPGFDAAPYLTATCVITKDPTSGVQNMGTYRAQLKAPTRLGMMMLRNARAGGLEHWDAYHKRKERMPVAIVLGCPPIVAFQGPQKLPLGVDELTVAGGLAGGPINVVKGRTVDLIIPAEAEVVIEGFIDPEYLEPEGPFGESHGYVVLEDYNLVVEVTAITRRRDAVLSSTISQVTPSESSVMKRLAYEPMYLAHLRDVLSIRGIKKVVMHEPLTNLRRFVFLQFARGTPRTEIWRALYGTASLQAVIGKYVIAIDEDIDANNLDAVFWALGYRCNPVEDMKFVPFREPGHGPRAEDGGLESALLVDATMKHPLAGLALPKREFMENAKVLWERLGLPKLRPEIPWFGYSMGDWDEHLDANALQATRGDWPARSESYRQRRRRDIAPNTPVRQVESDD